MQVWTCTEIPSRTAAQDKQNQDTSHFIYNSNGLSILEERTTKIIIILCSSSMRLEHLTPPNKDSRYPRSLQDQSKNIPFQEVLQHY